MFSIKHFLLFIKKYMIQIQRKWLSLPFLLLLPVIFAGLVIFLLLTFFTLEDQSALEIGLVDYDQSDETMLLTSLMEESSQLSSFLELRTMSETEASSKIDANELSAYLTFPDGFTNNLYTGESVYLSIIGNPERQMESFMVSQFIDSVIRQIRDSQANILTLNYYAKEVGMDNEARNDFVFEQFKEFVFFTLGRETIIRDRDVVNQVTSSPIHYYGVSGWFIITTIWCVILYMFFTKEDTPLMRKRIKLYGVTNLQQILAKLFVVFLMIISLSTIGFFLIYQTLELEIITQNIIRISITVTLYYLCIMILMAIIEVLIAEEKLRILIQAVVTAVLLLLSGAIVPTIYFPIWLEENLVYLFSYESFHWLTEIILSERFYVDFIPLTIMGAALLFILIGVSLGKERVTE